MVPQKWCLQQTMPSFINKDSSFERQLLAYSQALVEGESLDHVASSDIAILSYHELVIYLIHQIALLLIYIYQNILSREK